VQADKVAQKMQETENFSRSICLTDLGTSVLTLREVMQTFEVGSAMFNIKLPEILQMGVDYRTVVLQKSQVEIEGVKKLIIMVRDVTDKITLE